MAFDPGLKIGEEINNDRLCKIFLCSGQGGMRKSNKTNTLVIVSKHVGRIYDDRWIGETLHYTGMGLEGDQEIHLSQNKTLSQSKTNGVDLHLFEKFKEREYTYRSRIELSGKPYEEKQPDLKGNIRRVWMFPLRVKGRDHFSIDLTIQRGLEKEKEKRQENFLLKSLRKGSSSALESLETETLKQRPMRGAALSLSLQKEGQEEGVSYVQWRHPLKQRMAHPTLRLITLCGYLMGVRTLQRTRSRFAQTVIGRCILLILKKTETFL